MYVVHVYVLYTVLYRDYACAPRQVYIVSAHAPWTSLSNCYPHAWSLNTFTLVRTCMTSQSLPECINSKGFFTV